MYIPSAFRIDQPAKLRAFMQRHSFATLITDDAGAPFASHLPMLHQPNGDGHGVLVSHLARANPQAQHLAAGREVLVIFQGPHSYISPTWYKTQPAVPTWNYAAVHAHGIPKILHEPEQVDGVLREMVAFYESSLEAPWNGDLPQDYREKMLKAIVAFEIPIARLEGKFKLGQNRSSEDFQSVLNVLSQAEDSEGRALAQLMRLESHSTRADPS